jgi:hypothetical protein
MHRILAPAGYMLVMLSAYFISAGTAFALNEPEFTFPTGTRLSAKPEAPASLLGTGLGGVGLTQPAGTSIGGCDSFTIKASLEQNTGSLIEAKVTSATFGTCTTTGGSFTIETTESHGTPWCLRSTKEMAADQFQIRGGTCNTAPTKITLLMGKCTYERLSPMTGTFKTDVGEAQDAVLSLTGIEFTKQEVFCFGPASTVLDNINLTMELPTAEFSHPLYLS